ncbi:ATP-binding protein [Stutzerimonas balearica]|uniref:ATP-binding protein n=1 Tax=Stutzerimonas balearica TaxID=74829 RepID=UPI000E968AEC|nr:ATP-binding protein [Stutzerimonas balearica]HAV88574.1 AAA family ATPase [Pseudomonas sp.]
MQDANEQADGATLRERVQRLAPSPRCIADTGLGETLLAELLCKHLLDAGALDLPRMASRLRLPGIVLYEVLNGLRQDGRIEVLGQGQGQTLRYGLTERGREATRDALQRSGYLGPAPFAVDAYRSLLRLQTVHASRVDRQAIREAMRDVVLSDDMLDRLGVALNSNRALMLYGPPGTGKTFIASRLIRLFEEAIWVPHAIAIDDAIVPIYDAQIHRRLEDDATRNNLLLGEGIDRRLACCLRPQLRVGGELGMDQLDIRHDPVARLFHAPLQLKAANGLFVIDDLGRQRMPPEQLFNRWIVPLEEREDFLNLGGGRHCSLPFDVLLVFSTNFDPLDLADGAFLRRIGHKLHFGHPDAQAFERIWRMESTRLHIDFDPALLAYVLNELYAPSGMPLSPCHPRDLLNMACDRRRYFHGAGGPRCEDLAWAWQNYFIQHETEQGERPWARAASASSHFRCCSDSAQPGSPTIGSTAV